MATEKKGNTSSWERNIPFQKNFAIQGSRTPLNAIYNAIGGHPLHFAWMLFTLSHIDMQMLTVKHSNRDTGSAGS